MQLTPLQVAAAAYLGGFRGDQLVEAVAVAKGESAYNTEAGPNSACNCRGLWQINLDAHKKYSTPSILNPITNAKAARQIAGADWCGGRTAGGACKKFEAYGKSDANGTWDQKLAEGRKAKRDLEHEYDKNRLKNLVQLKSIGDTALDIMKKAGVDTTGQAPITSQEGVGEAVEGVGDAIAGVGSFFSFPNVEALAKALTSRATWLRAAEIFLGGAIVLVALASLSNVANKAVKITPVGRLVK